MQCKKCGTVISFKFKFAINSNICPGCGAGFLEDDQKEVLSKVAELIEAQASLTTEELLSWIFDNWSLKLKQIADTQVVETQEIVIENDIKPQEKITEIKVEPTITSTQVQQPNPFAKRAGIDVNKMNKLKDVVSSIKKENPQQMLLTPSQIAAITEVSDDNDATDWDETSEHDLNMQKLQGLSGARRPGSGNFRRG